MIKQLCFALLLSIPFFMQATVVHVTSQQQLAPHAQKGAVVKFSATWCGPCKALAPKFEQLAKDPAFNHVAFIAVDIDSARDLANRYNISSIPAIVFLKDGKTVHSAVGMSIGDIKNALTRYFPALATRSIDELKKKALSTTQEQTVQVAEAEPVIDEIIVEETTVTPNTSTKSPNAPAQTIVEQIQEGFRWIGDKISSLFQK